MIQDILPLHLQNQYEKKQPDDTSYMMIYRENKILVREGETLAFLTYRELQEICETAGEMAPQMCIRDRSAWIVTMKMR